MSNFEHPADRKIVRTATKCLCSTCAILFDGEWRKRNETPREFVDSDNAVENNPDHPTAIAGNSENDNDSVDDFGSEFYESHDWLQRSTESSSFASPLHHNTVGLEASAANGCQLCHLILDRLPKDYTGHETNDLEIWNLVRSKSPRIIGVAIVRPNNSQEGDLQTFCLEISFFVDGNPQNSGGYFCTIDFELLPVSEPADSVAAHVGDQIVSDVSAWTNQCRHSHAECQRKRSYLPTRRPARLIKVQPRAHTEPFLKLIDGSTLPMESEYVTLSHCWGKTMMEPLRSKTEAIYREETPWNVLTKTFQDAIRFTVRLGFQYLWIDSFCINQDKLLDWLEEALSMASIFSNAVLNLAATSSADGDGGLFPAKSPHLSTACVVETYWIGFPKTKYAVVDDLSWHRHINEVVLNHRAWVLQERLLSPRVVHFAHDQVSWECSEQRGNESWPRGIPYQDCELKTGAAVAFEDMTDVQGDQEKLNSCWLVIVSRYSECLLTKESDKLIAVAGLAQCTQERMQCQPTDYVAGLWKQFLIEDLLWCIESTGERYATYQAPSWSWASVRGAVIWNPSGVRSEGPKNFACRLQSVIVKLLFESKFFGPVSSACLELVAPLYRVVLGPVQLSAQPSLQFITINGRRFVDNETLAEVLDDGRIYFEITAWSANHSVYFCRFCTVPSGVDATSWESDGLLLARALEAEKGVFRRIGWMRIFHDENEADLDVCCMGEGTQFADGDRHDRHESQDGGKFAFKVL